MDEFEWMQPPTLPQHPERTLQTREDEVRVRARLLAKLGVPRKRAEAKLRTLLEWEYERLGKPVVLAHLGSLVSDAYKRTGKQERRGKAAKG